MLFNSLTFGVFFLIVLAGYWSLRSNRARLALLLSASWLFYAAWYPVYLVLYLGLTGLNFLVSIAIHRSQPHRPARTRVLVAGIIVVDLGLLAFFKYTGFALATSSSIAHSLLHVNWHPPLVHIFLPLGISFYTFELIAYMVDLYRGDCEWIRDPLKMSLFIAFFPHLIAGPIMRVHEFIGQLASARRFDARTFLHGLDLIALGLFKKVVVADQLAPIVDAVFAAPDGQSPLLLLAAVYAYAAQIYCDFSGYTDIGRGCAYCLGYELPRNFRAPYFAGSVTDFWRRWHITLSTWLRDYLYIPLGGNRQGRARTYLNLIVTMGLGGLWHGANWTFVVWGLLHGLALAGTRLAHEARGIAPSKPLIEGKLWRWFSVVSTFHFVALTWVFFRAPDFGTAATILGGLLALPASLALPATGRTTLAFVAAALFLLAGLHTLSTWARTRGVQNGIGWAVSRPIAYFVVATAVSLVADRGAQQFIYFQF